MPRAAAIYWVRYHPLIPLPRQFRTHLGGVIGNERLTTVAGLALVPLLAAELLTLLALGALLTAHLFIGLWLVVPLAAKMGSTGYRFLRYYTGARDYVQAGPPRWPARLLAPIVVVATLVLIGSGLALWALGPSGREPFLVIHKLSFQVWWISLVGHVLVHLGHVRRDSASEFVQRQDGYSTRASVVGAAVLLGLVVAVSLILLGPPWPANTIGD